MSEPELVDQYGRKMRKVRVSLLDACNLRCLYCMPEDTTFGKVSDFLAPHDLAKICRGLNELGVEQIRVTGGEPLLHPQFKDYIEEFSQIPFKEFGLTTNGILLKKYLPFLKKTPFTNLNISLDSLDRANHQNISKRDTFPEIMESIFLAIELGFKVKINMVVMYGINHHEIEEFVRFAMNYRAEVRFLELMKIGPGLSYFQERFYPAFQIKEHMKSVGLISARDAAIDSTSQNFLIGKKGKVGIIASESRPFCDNCSRLRLSAKGLLRPCLMKDQGLSLVNLEGAERKKKIEELIRLKPANRIHSIKQSMNQIGG